MHHVHGAGGGDEDAESEGERRPRDRSYAWVDDERDAEDGEDHDRREQMVAAEVPGCLPTNASSRTWSAATPTQAAKTAYSRRLDISWAYAACVGAGASGASSS